jgi:DNA-binding MarR family transcriptional regulator
MNPISTTDPHPPRHRRRLTTTIKEALRELSNQLSVLNHHVSAHLELRDTDLDCLDLIARHGPISPTTLAQRTGLHPATITGILDRLQHAGWIARDRDPTDRRAVRIQALRDRNPELFHLYAGMNSAMDQVCATYDDNQLQVIADFLRRTTHAGQAATDQLASD